jgi:hypothetical protein
MFSSERELQLEIDASNLAISGCLTQIVDKKRVLITYYSRKLSLAEQNYNIYDKELLAVVVSLEHFRIYAIGVRNLTVYIDYKNLTTFLTTKVLNRRQVR